MPEQQSFVSEPGTLSMDTGGWTGTTAVRAHRRQQQEQGGGALCGTGGNDVGPCYSSREGLLLGLRVGLGVEQLLAELL